MEFITIHSPDNAYEAKIIPERGANCISLCHVPSGASFLRTYGPETEELDNPFLYGMPILFPPNRIIGGKMTYEGREYQFPINEENTGCFLHGTIHETPFETLSVSENRAVFAYQATKDEPYLSFPHEFTITVVYELTNDGLKQTLSVQNNSGLKMPMGLAYHTTFAMPFIKGGKVENIRMQLPIGEEYDRDMSDCSMTWETVKDDDFHSKLCGDGIVPCQHTISRHFSRPKGAALRLTDTESGYSIVYDASEEFKYWMTYNGGDPTFFCVEPQTWIINAPSAPAKMGDVNIIGLEPGEIRDFVTTLKIEK